MYTNNRLLLNGYFNRLLCVLLKVAMYPNNRLLLKCYFNRLLCILIIGCCSMVTLIGYYASY
jgi:hypothetical protein